MAVDKKALDVAAGTPTTEVSKDPKAAWVYVNVPAEDILGGVFPGVGINRDHYGPGTHLVSPEIAEEIRTIVARAQAQDIRILQPRKDMKALTDLYKLRGRESVDLTETNTKQV